MIDGLKPMFWSVKHAACKETIILKEHDDDLLYVTLACNHHCPADNIDYLIEITRAVTMKINDPTQDPDGKPDDRDYG